MASVLQGEDSMAAAATESGSMADALQEKDGKSADAGHPRLMDICARTKKECVFGEGVEHDMKQRPEKRRSVQHKYAEKRVGHLADYVVFHSLAKNTLFLCAGTYIHETGRMRADELEPVCREKIPLR